VACSGACRGTKGHTDDTANTDGGVGRHQGILGTLSTRRGALVARLQGISLLPISGNRTGELHRVLLGPLLQVNLFPRLDG
jgi:hypothetical protein